jgi:putative redox protein
MSSSVRVEENGQGRYQQQVQAGQHAWLSDEPESLGGADAGAAPFDFLMAALGSCTSITLRMYAERKNFALDKISVQLEHEKIEVDGKPRDHIKRRIELSGKLSSEERQRLLDIANKCPVYRTLSQPVLISSELAA